MSAYPCSCRAVTGTPIRTSASIAASMRLGALAGRVIGLIDYQRTAGIWLRGTLSDDNGVWGKQ